MQMELKVGMVSISIHEGWVDCPENRGCMTCVNYSCLPWKYLSSTLGGKWVYVNAVPIYSSRNHIPSDDICYRYWRPINRCGTLVEWQTNGETIAHGCWLILVLGMFWDVFAQHSVCGYLAVRITVVPLGHTIDDRPLKLPILLIVCWLNQEVPHETLFHSNGSILIWTWSIDDFFLSLKFFWMHVTTNQLNI